MLAELGYTGAAITLDHGHLDPYAPGLAGEVAAVGKLLGDLGMNAVVETGGRYTLDPRRKHYPTLLDDAADRRIDYLTRAIRVAAELGAPVVHLWSGAIPAGLHPDEAWARLARGCEHLLRCGRTRRRGARVRARARACSWPTSRATNGCASCSAARSGSG